MVVQNFKIYYIGFMRQDMKFNSFIPIIKTKLDMTLYAVFPFNLMKGTLISIITFLIYKRLCSTLNGIMTP